MDLHAKIEAVKAERPRAGTRFRLMGLTADITEVAQALEQDVLERVRTEVVLDVDMDIDFAEMAEEVMVWEMEGPLPDEEVAQVNEALGVLSGVLAEIAEQMERRHSEEEYVQLYEAEKRRYLASGTAQRARRKFEEWKQNVCYGCPSAEETDDYRLEKVLHLFEKGALDERVEHIQRAKRYPGELDFEQLDGDLKLTKTVYHHYAALRKLVDFKDGALVVNPARMGQHFYASRHEVNAKKNRTNFLKYMHKVAMVQEEKTRIAAEKGEADMRNCPDCLRTAEAVALWQKAQRKGWVDAQWQPTGLSRSDAALLANRMAELLDIDGWKPFEQLWNRANIRQDYSKAMGKQGATEFIDELKKAMR